MLDPNSLRKCLHKISEQFINHANSKGTSAQAIQKMAKQAQKLIKHLQNSPESSHSRNVIETFELLSSVCPNDNPDVYAPCSKIISSIFRFLPIPELLEIWKITQDMNLCCSISESIPISSDLYFEKLCFFLENPSIEDPTWYWRFVEMLKCRLDGDIDYHNVLPFALYMCDNSPLRSTLAFLILNTFSQINVHVAIKIVSAWVVCDHRNPIIANHCRSILKKSPTDTLNMLSTLSFDLPIIFAILPPDIEVYQTLCLITVHRIKSFMPDTLSEFLCLCDVKAREIVHRESSSKNNKTPNLALPDLNIPKELQLFDAALTGSRSRNAVSEMMEAQVSSNFLAAAVLFARYSSLEDASFLPPKTANKILGALRQNYNNKLALKPCSQYKLEEIEILSNLIEKSEISQIIQMYGQTFSRK